MVKRIPAVRQENHACKMLPIDQINQADLFYNDLQNGKTDCSCAARKPGW